MLRGSQVSLYKCSGSHTDSSSPSVQHSVEIALIVLNRQPQRDITKQTGGKKSGAIKQKVFNLYCIPVSGVVAGGI